MPHSRMREGRQGAGGSCGAQCIRKLRATGEKERERQSLENRRAEEEDESSGTVGELIARLNRHD